MSSYVTTIVAGPYVDTTDEYVVGGERVVPLGVYCRKSLVEHMDLEEILDLAKKDFTYYGDPFTTPYTFTRYDQIFVPEFNAGVMKNTDCVTHRDDYIFRSRPVKAHVKRRAVTILHELAHMWFGDMVAMIRWGDLWLDESFAEYTSILTTVEIIRWNQVWATFQTLEEGWAYNQGRLSSTHPVAAKIHDPHDVEINFGGITYTKGASILTALMGYVNREDFSAGIQHYLAAHAYASTGLSDLLRELEGVSGRDLSTWAHLWLQETGVTTLRTQLATDAEGLVTQTAVRQEIPTDSPASLRPHRMAIGCYNLTGQGAETRLERTNRIELDVDGKLTEAPKLASAKRVDILVLNDNDLAYAKVCLDEDSLSLGLEHIEAFTDSLSCSIVLASAQDMVRNGELTTSRFLDAALRAPDVEEYLSVIQKLLGRTTTCLSGFLPPAVRRSLAPGTADRLLGLARATQPGSDKQLQLVWALTAHAVTDEQLDVVAGLVEGNQALGSLDVDQGLCWGLLIGLVAAGRSREEQVRAGEARNRMTTGHEHTVETRASISTPEAKQAAWRTLVDDASMPNKTQVRVLRGLTNIERHPELLTPFVGAYAEAIDSVWSSYTFHITESLLAGLWSYVTMGLVGADDPAATLAGWLESHAQAPAALRRIVRGNLDGTLRVARAQAAGARSVQQPSRVPVRNATRIGTRRAP